MRSSGGEAVALEFAREQRRLGAVDGRDADQDVGDRRLRDAVVELGHRARADHFAEAPEAAALLGDRHREQGLALLADLGALGDEAQAIEVHVGAAGDRDVGLAVRRVRVHVLLDGGDAERAGRLEDAARVLEDVLDRGARGVGVDDDPFVDELARQAERLRADPLDGGAVGKEADVGELDALAGVDRSHHRVGVVHLHADDADLGPHRLDVRRDARDQAAAADGDEDGVDRPLVLAQDLHRDRALAGDDIGVVERMDEGEAALLLERHRLRIGVGVAVAEEHHLGAERADRGDLERRRGRRHDDQRLATESTRREGDALRVVARRGADHAARQRLRREVRHLVVRAAQLEAEHRLGVLALEEDPVVEPRRERRRRIERRLDRDVVDARSEDLLEVARQLQRALRRVLAGGRRHALVLSAGTRLRQRIIRGDPAEATAATTSARPEKSPRRCRLGLNPPMKEVEETIGSIGCAAVFGAQRGID